MLFDHSAHYQQLRTLAPTTTQQWTVAYSGGVDSHVLLHWLCQESDLPITVVHINHQLHSDASKWEAHCQSVCQSLPVTYISKTIEINHQSGDSLEAAARDARYFALAEYVNNENTCLLTAHHQGDQAETLLLQLCRGAGVRGLAAMPAITPFAKGHLARPFLSLSRKEILHYAAQQKLIWLEDPSNQSLRFDRNFMRHHIIPTLRERWPSVDSTLARSAELCAISDELNMVLAEMDYQQLTCQAKETLSLTTLRQLTLVRQANVLRYWMKLNHLLPPSYQQLQQIIHTVCNAQPDAKPLFEFANGMQLRRYQDILYVLPIALIEVDLTWQATWDLQSPLPLPHNLGELRIQPTSQQPALCLPKDAQLTLCFRQGGERFHPHDRVGSHPLKKLCQEWHILPWQRQQLVLGYWQETLVMVCDVNSGVIRYVNADKLQLTQSARCHYEVVYSS